MSLIKRNYVDRSGDHHQYVFTHIAGLPVDEYNARKSREYRERRRQSRMRQGNPPRKYRHTQLNEQQIDEIKRRFDAGATKRLLMKDFEISYPRLEKILV